MTTRLRFILAAFAVSASIVVHAETAPVRSNPGRTLGPLLAVLDSNRDGTLSAKEIAAAPVTLTALDLNEDGVISPAEWQSTRTEGGSTRTWRGAVSLNVALTLDANHDGDIQAMEIANAISSLKRLDVNGDGQLTPDELRPGMTVARTHI